MTLGSEACLNTPTNFHELAAGGFKTLVDCSSNDGALIDSISIMAPEASITEADVIIFISTVSTPALITTSNTAFVSSAVIASTEVGERTDIPLPPLLAPVPGVGSDAKNTGLFVPAGKTVYAGLSTVIAAPTAGSRVHVFAQGGLY